VVSTLGVNARLLTPTGREVLARYLAGGRIAFSVDRAADIRQVLAYSERNGVHPVIIGGAQAWQVAALLAKSHVPVVLDPFLDLPGSFDQLGASLENAARLHQAGVPITFTNFSMPTHAAHKVRHAAGLAVAHGLPWDAALAALTTTPSVPVSANMAAVSTFRAIMSAAISTPAAFVTTAPKMVFASAPGSPIAWPKVPAF
jgi:hypothetical protein